MTHRATPRLPSQTVSELTVEQKDWSMPVLAGMSYFPLLLKALSKKGLLHLARLLLHSAEMEDWKKNIKQTIAKTVR